MEPFWPSPVRFGRRSAVAVETIPGWVCLNEVDADVGESS